MMKIFKYIAASCAFAALFVSCESEVCPVPYCTMTFNIEAPQSLSANDGLAAKQIAVFLRNDATREIAGPINVDMSKAVVDAGSVAGTFTCRVTQALPYGKYTMWMWANVLSDKIYSFDRFSLIQFNGFEGSDYLLCKAHEIEIGKRHDSTDIRLERLTAMVQVSTQAPVSKSISFYVSDVYSKVNAEGVYSDPKPLEFETGVYVNVPPAKFYTFPTAESVAQSELYLSYNQSGSAVVESQVINKQFVAGQQYSITFGTIIP